MTETTTLDQMATLVALGGTAVTGVGFVSRLLWRAYRRAVQLLDDIIGGIADLKREVATIRHEVTLNGGASLKDKVRRIGQQVTEMHHESHVSTAARRLSDTRALCEMLTTESGGDVCTYVSKEWTRLTGLVREQMEDGGWLRCIPISEQPRIARLAEDASRSHSIFQAEYQLVSGQWVRHIGEPVIDNEGALAGWVGEITPIPTPEHA